MLSVQNLSLSRENTLILRDLDFLISPGEMVAIVGRSGAGKSSLFRILTGEWRPSSGSVALDEFRLESLSKKNIQSFRRQIGVIFQDYKLLPHKNVEENVAYPLLALGENENVREKVETALHAVGILDKAQMGVRTLSGGEKQRVAIARALVHDPKILLADEPTGNLDPQTTQEIAEILISLHQSFGLTILLSTHDESLLKTIKPRIIEIKQGKVKFDGEYDAWRKSLRAKA